MKALYFQKRLFALLILMIAAISCKQPETIIVDRNPKTAAPSDTSDTVQAGAEGEFQQLAIGENQLIHSLDPLLASNLAEMHAIQLVYEGLVRLNSSEEVIPAVAKRWTVQNINQSCTFTLRSDIFFHASSIFGSGTGRKLKAGDVKFVFERMAHNNVPPQAALMFMNIEGMNAYYQEQRHVYDPEQRGLSGISGISAPNDSTVVFQLNRPDPDFLKKLATPRAVVYPKEATESQTGTFTAVASGPFTFSQHPNDSTYIFARFGDYYHSSDIKLDRVDIISSADENALWQAMQAGDIHYLPGTGPQLAERLLSDEAKLIPEAANSTSLSGSVETELTLHRYFDAELPPGSASAIARLAEQNTASLFAGMGPGISNPSFTAKGSTSASMSNLKLQAVASDNPYAEQLLKNLQKMLSQKGASLTISNLQVPTRETGLFVTEQWPLLSISLWRDSPALLSFDISRYSLTRDGLSNIDQSRYPWWIDLRNIQLSNNLN